MPDIIEIAIIRIMNNCYMISVHNYSINVANPQHGFHTLLYLS